MRGRKQPSESRISSPFASESKAFTIKNQRLYSQNTSSFCCFFVQLIGREVVGNEGRGVWAQTWSGAHGDSAWSADVGVAAWVT
ncbi:hypothetical protein ES319_A08G224500v1 [Gossypium barbadense]|uniref:Uncharacterized protein n=2 Tax=Gossypium TaxID=3633 RepID=A0A5J5UVR0_GOSBA|nr:hypothetical protein ES319_A08G224500v1 [Gossypium barbadense]TYH07624.1 hypothetical protein ES288_A08G248100v1 [Gossypium darwinii]